MAGVSDRTGRTELEVRIELGRAQLERSEVETLCPGTVVPLDSLTDDPVDIYVNDRLIARGQLVVINDNFCVRVTEFVAREAMPIAA
jgi:flagellar motor switch protein FliN/FliY